MKQGKTGVWFGFLFTFCAVAAGWYITKDMLDRKETEILGRKGVIQEMASELPARENDEEQTKEAEFFQGAVLSEEEMVKILKLEKEGGREVLHEPEERQMNMQQAVQAGQEWITALAQQEMLPDFLTDYTFSKIDAKLYRVEGAEEAEGMDDSLRSFWRLIYSGEDVKLELTLHAASGQVWQADICMNAGRGLCGEGTDEELLEKAFPYIHVDKKILIMEKTENILYVKSLNGKIGAAVRKASLAVSGQEAVDKISLWLEALETP